MDVGRSLTYMFRQPGGLGKLIIGGLLLLVPILGWLIVGGYMVRTLRGVALRQESLPDWNDWGDLIVKGLILWVASVIYNIPGFILGQIGFDAIASLWGLVVYFFLPAAIIRFAVTDNAGAFLDLSAIIEFIQRNISNYIIALVVVFIATFVAAFGILLLLIGVLFTFFWAALVAAHLYGSVYAAAADQPTVTA